MVPIGPPAYSSDSDFSSRSISSSTAPRGPHRRRQEKCYPPPTLTPEPELSFLEAGGLRFHVAEAGPRDGRLVVLLHGFPELWYGWRHQIGGLAGAGFRVLAPDQRGYNLSAKPRGVSAYRIDRLAGDVVGLIRASGRERACLVGHDWGAAVAWWTALAHPERVERLAILNVPHPAVMRRHMLRNPAQRRRSWYIFFFQLPWLPELWLRRRGFRVAERSVRGTARPGAFSDEDMDRYREAWGRPRALTSMLHWYRAALRRRPPAPESLRVRQPTLVLWGMRDRFLGPEMIEPSLELCDRAEAVRFGEATHWLQHEEPAAVNSLLVEFLGGGEGS